MPSRHTKNDRRLRRALEHSETVNAALKRVALLNGIEAVKAHDASTDRELARMAAKVRTLKYDNEAKAQAAPSQAAVIAQSGLYNEHSEGVEETRKGYLIPRRALCVKLHLALVRPLMELDDRLRRDLTLESRAELERNHKAVMREHPANRARLAARLNASFVPQWTEGSDSFQVWRSDSTLLDRHRLIGSTVKVQRQNATGRTFERDGEREPLPTRTDDTGQIIDPNLVTDTGEPL